MTRQRVGQILRLAFPAPELVDEVIPGPDPDAPITDRIVKATNLRDCAAARSLQGEPQHSPLETRDRLAGISSPETGLPYRAQPPPAHPRHDARGAVEMLTDNGAPDTAKDTRIFARQLGLRSCFTPVKSPQRNGLSEAFVNTLKRDYVRVAPLPNAETVLALIGDWIEGHNDNHPHSGLKWRSPREFIAAQNATA